MTLVVYYAIPTRPKFYIFINFYICENTRKYTSSNHYRCVDDSYFPLKSILYEIHQTPLQFFVLIDRYTFI